MKRGTIVEVRVVDGTGHVALRYGQEQRTGQLLDATDAFMLGQRIRLQLGVAEVQTEGGFCDADLVVQGTVVRAGPSVEPAIRVECSVGARFAFEVARITRGLLWTEVNAAQSVDAVAPVVDPQAPTAAEFGRAPAPLVDVRVQGDQGELELSHGDRVYRGMLLHVPVDLSVGQELHVRVVATLAGVVPSVREHTDLLVKVVQVRSGGVHGGRASYRDGVCLAVAIVRQTAGDVELPVVDAAQVEQLIRAALPLPPPAPLSTGDRDEHTPSLRLRRTPDIVGEPSGIMGSLRQMPLADLLQSMQANRKTACVEINSSGHQGVGHAYLRDGELIAAFDGDCAGEEALRSMIRLESGTFRIRFGVAAPVRNIERSLTHVLLDAMRALDEELHDQMLPPPLPGAIADDDVIELDSADIIEVEALPVGGGSVVAARADVVTPPPLPVASVRGTRRAVFASFFAEVEQAEQQAPHRSLIN